MRIKVNLNVEPPVSIPIEYNYNVYLGIRKLLLDFLGNRKPKLFNRYQKTFPDFTFSQLMIPARTVEMGFIEITGNYFSFFVSSIDNDFIEYFVKALNNAREFSVHQKHFELKKVEFIEEPEFESEMKFRMLSPLLLIKVIDSKAIFLRPGDSDLGEQFSNHLVNKYNGLFNTRFKPGDIHFALDQEYLERGRGLTRLLTIRNINYKTIISPFHLKGETELIRFAHQNGIGEKTQYGLGMIEKI